MQYPAEAAGGACIYQMAPARERNTAASALEGANRALLTAFRAPHLSAAGKQETRDGILGESYPHITNSVRSNRMHDPASSPSCAVRRVAGVCGLGLVIRSRMPRKLHTANRNRAVASRPSGKEQGSHWKKLCLCPHNSAWKC